MIVPVRCFSCGKPIAQDWEEYQKRAEKGDAPKKILDDMGHTRYCCRRVFLSHCELIDEIMRYKRF